jgi:predicted GIY-YIG superfamily endonuclease
VPDAPWFLYVLVSNTTGRTYVGVTTAPERRLDQHNGARAGGAKATRSGRPWQLGATYGPFETRAEAQRAEHALKRKRGRARLAWSPPAPGPDA